MSGQCSCVPQQAVVLPSVLAFNTAFRAWIITTTLSDDFIISGLAKVVDINDQVVFSASLGAKEGSELDAPKVVFDRVLKEKAIPNFSLINCQKIQSTYNHLGTDKYIERIQLTFHYYH